MTRLVLSAAFCAAPLSTVAAADFYFCWVGGNGFTMTGRMAVPDSVLSRAIVTEADVTRFKIAGYADGQLLGTWDMAQRAPDDTWHLRFDPVRSLFLTGESFSSTASQGWNANGDVTDCGNPGFGFNSGDYAQDICVNGAYMFDSSIPPETPLHATTQPFSADCSATAPVSKRATHSD